VLVDHELVATLEQVDERDPPVNAGDLDRAVELEHRQPPPGPAIASPYRRDALERPFSIASSSVKR
jgi:hypothetical protein